MFEAFLQVREWIEEYSTRDVTLEQLYEGATAGMVDAIDDPYSQYLTREQYQSLTSSLEGEYVGIGVTIDLVEGQITVINTFKGSPAEKAGLKSGDVIIGADGQDLRGKVPADAQSILRGELGTSVSVTVRRPSEAITIELDIARDLISQDALDVRDLGNGQYYIRIPQFTAKAANEFKAVIGYLRLANVKGLVLDLRDDPGGLLEACLDIASELVPKGTIVELRRRELKQTLENSVDPPSTIPIAVLANKGSASASEILAGAIRDRGVGILVGDTTFGKACVQTVAALGNGTGLRLTIADYYTPSGYSLAGKGLDPDIRVLPTVTIPPMPLVFKRVIVPGLVGLDVLALQESLKFLGYETGEPDGVFGQKTALAVDRFLVDQHLQWDGFFGQAASERLSAAITDKVLNKPDTVLDAAIVALTTKLTTGAW